MVMNIFITRDIIASMFRPLAMQTSGLQAQTHHGHDLSMIHGYGATQKFVTLQRESFRDRMHYF
nr:unnamed protein product [Callosobruchus chinensis]